MLDTWIFSGGRNLVKDVMTFGEWRVRDGRHVDEELISRRFAEAVQRLA